MQILASYITLINTSPKAISSARSSSLLKVINQASRGRFSISDILELKKIAKNSVGIDNVTLSFQIQLTIQQILFFKSQSDEIADKIDCLFSEINSPISSIHGIGSYNGSVILSYIGNIKRFSSPSQILAFAGLDPSVRQSGKFNAESTRISKRGSSLLRFAIINAAHNVAKNEPVFKAYYQKKILEGKKHYNALGHVANKLIRLIFVLLNKNINYNPALCK